MEMLHKYLFIKINMTIIEHKPQIIINKIIVNDFHNKMKEIIVYI